MAADSQALHNGSGVADNLPPLWPSIESGDDTVTPPREARSTDASKLTFPVQMTIGAIVMTATILGGVYGMVNGIRESQMKTESDLRDLRTRFEMQGQVDMARNEARAAEVEASKSAIDDLRRLTQMLQLQYQEIAKARK